jgi:hypothetical protein
MAIKCNKTYDGVDEDFKATKFFVPVCTKHEVVLKENEGYSFARQVGETEVIWEFDEDEVDLSGFDCPRAADEENCNSCWTAIEITTS